MLFTAECVCCLQQNVYVVFSSTCMLFTAVRIITRKQGKGDPFFILQGNMTILVGDSF